MEYVEEMRPEALPVARSARPDVSVIVVTWNSSDWIEKCLDAIQVATNGYRVQSIVFDNASSDATAAKATNHGVQLVESDHNHGFAGGVNRALRSAHGRFILLLNPDCEPEPGSIDRLVKFLDARPDVAAAVPLLVGEDRIPQKQFQLRALPTVTSVAAELLLLHRLIPGNRIASDSHYRDLELSSPQPIEQPAAAAMLIRRDVIDEIGEFDERFEPAWFEDVDYCRRMKDEGHSIYLVPDAVALHHGGASLDHVSHEQFIDIWYRNLYLYSRKWFGRSEAELVRWLTVFGMLLRVLALALGVSPGPVSRKDALRGYSRVMRQALLGWHDARRSS